MTVSSEYSAEVIDDLPVEQLEVVHSYLRAHNRAANPDLWAKFTDPSHDPKPLHVVVRNDAYGLVGGLTATTCMSWLKVAIVAVREEHRRKGFGTLMLDAAEAEARRRGCKYSFLDTMDYQSPDFYLKCGYDLAGSIPDWDSHGHTKFYFTKQLNT